MVGTIGNNVCRRCKKKRPEDEPMETARYRTCKPCREIERKLKRIKKAQLTGQSVDDIHADMQSKKAHEIEQNIIQMARQVQNSLPQSDVQSLSESDLALHAQQQQLNAISAAVSAAAAAVNAVNQGPPQIHQYDQSRDSISAQHQPLMPVQSAADSQKEIPIDESLLKQGTEDESPFQSANGPGDGASLTKSPILKSEVSPSTAVSTTGEQTDSKPTPQQNNNNIHNNNNNNTINNNNNNTINNIENNNNKQDTRGEGEKSEKEQRDEVEAHQAELEAKLSGTKSVGTSTEAIQYCLYCGVERSIDDNGRYNLCGNCVNNPLQKENVFDEFESYLDRIESGQHEDLNYVIFIKKTCDDIPDFVQYNDGDKPDANNLVEVVTSLNDKYIYRIIERSGFRFSKSSSNFSAKPFPKSIKLLFKCKQDIKTVQKQQMISPQDQPAATVPGGNNSNVNNRRLKTEDCHSNFYLSYDVIGKSLSIKFNHLTHTPYLEKLYTGGVLDKVRQIATKENGAKEGYAIWKQVAEQEQNAQLKNEMTTVKEMVFCKDFGPLFKDFTY